MSLSKALMFQVDSGVRERGKSYFLSGRVKLDTVSHKSVAATVRGSTLYEVDLAIDGRTILVGCTCPYSDGSDVCKHIWATILAADVQGFAAREAMRGKLELQVESYDGEDDDLDDYDDDLDEGDLYYRSPRSRSQNARPTATKPAPSKPSVASQEAWLTQLDTLRKQLGPTPTAYATQSLEVRPAERQLVYIVDLQASAQAAKLVMDIATRDRKKDGDWCRPQVQYLNTHQIAAVTDPLDRRIMALLAGAEQGEGYSSYYRPNPGRYRISDLLLPVMLPLLTQTGRLRLRKEPKAPELVEPAADSGLPWNLVIRVTPSDDGKKWVLAGALRRDEELISVVAPTLIVPGLVVWNDRFAPLHDDGSFAWVPMLRRQGAISVPINRGADLLAQLAKMPRLPKLELPEELLFNEVSVPPQPRLVLQTTKNSWQKQVLYAELSFRYDDQIAPAQPRTRGIFHAESRRLLLRDPVVEEAALRELERLGLRQELVGGELIMELKPTLLPKLVRELVPAGWQVQAEGKLYRKPGDIQMEVRTEHDWFDLKASANFDGLSVSLPRLLAALRGGEQSVVLDDGSLGMLPEDWLKKYGLIAKLGTVHGDQVRFSRAQIGVLDALLASRPEISFDKQFARARDQLRKFSGVNAAQPPKRFKGELRAYQQEGLGWLRFLRKFGFGGCLADDMGLGKTVQVLSLLAGLKAGPSLVVVPRSLIFNWKQEAAKFAPKMRVLDHTGTTRDRTGAAFKDHDLVVTTYGTLRKDAEIFANYRFDTCILDESQAAKNANTETAKAVRLLQSDHRLALSGTPVENHLGELWTLFDFLNPGMLGNASFFAGAGAMRNPPPEIREVLAKALRPYILRRTKDQVAKDLPAKTEQTVYCDLESNQRKLYDELRDHYRLSLLKKVDEVGLARSKIHVLEALLRLRQAACHPGLIDKKRTGESSAKMDVLMPHLQELAESGRKALVFSQFTSLLSLVRNRLDRDGVTYEYLDGRTRDRRECVERFQTDPKCKLFLISLKAGGVGLNLTAAEYVFLLDPWWNPAVEAQAIDRSHRIGQEKAVFAYRLIARDTVEEKVLALQQSKRELADAILGGTGLITDLKREDLEMLLS